MRTFTDTAGREWPIAIDIPARAKVQKDAGFDVFAALDETELKRLNDPALLVAVLFSLCEEQARKLAVSPEQFARGFNGDTLDAASDALMGALADFFPSRRRAVIQALLEKGKAASLLAAERIEQKVMDLDLESLLPPTLRRSSGSSPASPASMPISAD